MSYQAVVRNSKGAVVVSQEIGIRITILQGSDTGVEVYTETQKTVTNKSGLMSLEIGINDDFATIEWAKGPFYIKTETDINGGENYTITGTSQLLSVPYALYAEKSGTTEANVINDEDQSASGLWSSEKIKAELNAKADTSSLATLATTGSFSDLTNLPTTASEHGITDVWKLTEIKAPNCF
ncbi:MAG: hypothetical protein IPO21_18515 [Bacteroidales bacterium]|nr:hypothetical protein [Bacteroidales bacterium]